MGDNLMIVVGVICIGFGNYLATAPGDFDITLFLCAGLWLMAFGVKGERK